MLNSRNCLINTVIEKIPTKFNFHCDEKQHEFSVNLPGAYFALGSLDLEIIKDIGHNFALFDETKKDQALDFGSNRIEIYVDIINGKHCLDIWFHWNGMQICFGQFSLADFRKLGSFFVEYGLSGHEATNDDIYCDPVERYLDTLLAKGDINMDDLGDINKLKELADNAESIPGFEIVDMGGDPPQDYLDRMFEDDEDELDCQ